MTTPTLLSTVGFEKGKIGSDDKEAGYWIEKDNLQSFLGSFCVTMLVLVGITVMLAFDIHIERKASHREFRRQEHHAAKHLAHSQLELWSQYHDDVRLSKEATQLMQSLNRTYGRFERDFQTHAEIIGRDIGITRDQATKLADKVLKLVVEMEKINVKRTKKLVDHLVAEGKKGNILQKHLDKELTHKMEEEDQKDVEDYGEHGEEDPEDADQEFLQATLDAFFKNFEKHLLRIPLSARKKLEEKNVQQALKKFTDAWGSEADPEQQMEDLAKWATESAHYDFKFETWGLPAVYIQEELSIVPSLPYGELEKISKEYKKMRPFQVVSQLEKLHMKGSIPTFWMNEGIEEGEEKELEAPSEAP